MPVPAAFLSAKARNICAGNKSGAAGFRFAQKGGHQAMRIDDAGGRRKKSARALQRWFNLANLGWLKPAQIVDAIGRRQGPDEFYLSQLTMCTGKDELDDPPVRYGVARAIIITAVAHLTANGGFERAGVTM